MIPLTYLIDLNFNTTIRARLWQQKSSLFDRNDRLHRTLVNEIMARFMCIILINYGLTHVKIAIFNKSTHNLYHH